MLSKILMILLLASTTFQECNKGCLKCSGSTNCLLCDRQLNYYNSLFTCVLSTRTNCDLLANDGTCLQCAKNFYLDASTANCAALTLAEEIPGCKYYNSSKACIRCENRFFISGVTCALSTIVLGCLRYSADGVCAFCDSGFVFNTDRSDCVTNPITTTNCGAFNVVSCDACAPGYFFNRSLYFSYFSNQGANTASIQLMEELETGNLLDWSKTPVCQALTVLNCAQGSDAATCTSCKPGFYLEANICKVFTKTFCASPSPTSNTCVTCSPNYFLNAGGNCQIYTAPNCATFQASTDGCATCNAGFYFTAGPNTCTQYTAPNCVGFELNLDQCLACSSGSYSTVPPCPSFTVSNCATRSTTEDKCLTCPLNFYKSSDNCQPFTAANCKTQSLTENKCLTCDVGFYLDAPGSFSCLVNSAPLCLTRSTAENKCLTCPFRHYLDGTSGACVAMTVSNCLTHSTSANVCLTCPPNYYTDVNNNCLLNSQLKCASLSTSDNTCLTCVAGYLLNAGVCGGNTALNCLVKSVTLNQCDICVADAHLNGVLCDLNPPNCWTYNGDKSACLVCAGGYYLSSGLCPQNTKTNCLDKSHTSNICDVCNSGYYNSGGTCNAYTFTQTNCEKKSETSDSCDACYDGYYFSAGACTANPVPIIANCVIFDSDTTCDRCQKTFSLTSTTTCTSIAPANVIARCLKHIGIILTPICTLCDNSIDYLNGNVCSSGTVADCTTFKAVEDKCEVCNAGKVPTTGNEKCLTEITNCLTYATSNGASTSHACTVCKDTYFLQDPITCTSGSILSCRVYTSQTVCATCDATHYLSGSNCLAHVTIDNCLTYHPTMQNICSVCDGAYHSYEITAVCQSKTVIANCQTYAADGNTCTTCKPGYFRTSATTCELPSGNCNSWDNTNFVCLGCGNGYGLETASDTCVAPFAFATSQCETITDNITFPTDGSVVSICKKCKQDKIPLDLSLTFQCVESAHFATFGISSLVTGCIRYNSGGPAKCVECAPSKYLSDINGVSPTCEDYTDGTNPCLAANSLILLDNLDGRVFGCITITDPPFNCDFAERVDTTDDTQARFECLRVKSGFRASYPSSDFQTEYSKKIAHKYNELTVLPGAVYYRGYHVVIFDQTGKTINVNTPDDCELFYSTVDANTYSCYKAKTYGQTVVTAANGDSSFAAITRCESDPTKQYSGFPSFLSAILSCNKCQNFQDNLDYTLVVEIQLTGAANTSWAGPKSSTSVVQCSDRIPLVENCHLYGNIYPNGSTTFTRICLACRPGYLPAAPASPTEQNEIGSCTAITNCDLSSSENLLVNRCAKCLSTSNYALLDTNFTSCVLTDTPNCYIAGSLISGSTYYCKICQPGFTLVKGQCVTFSLIGCSSNSSMFPAVTNSNLFEYNLLSAKAKNRVLGCNSCTDSANKLVKLKANSVYCSQISNVAPTEVLPGCQYLEANLNASDPKYNCANCSSGTVIDTTKQCGPLISNCLYSLSSDTSKCFVCAYGYYNNAGVCPQINIPTCQTFPAAASTVTSPSCVTCNSLHYYKSATTSCDSNPAKCQTYDDGTSTCTQCVSGHYYKVLTTSCEPIPIANCAIYNDGTSTCTTCNADYVFLDTAGTDFCLQFTDAIPKCLTVDTTDAQSSKLKCTSCLINDTEVNVPMTFSLHPDYSTLPHSKCLRHDPHVVLDCNTYDQVSLTISTLTFYCSTCNSGNYKTAVTPPACNTIPTVIHCETFTNDACSKCESGYFLNGTDCDQLPDQIAGCFAYSSPTICTSCASPYFLAANKCLDLTTTAVAGCIAYSANDSCSHCDTGKALVGAACVTIVGTGCKTYDANGECATCDYGKYLTTPSPVNCADNNLSDCAEFSSDIPLVCTRCNSGYFIVIGACVSPSPAIPQCRTHSDPSTCQACYEGFVLTANECKGPQIIPGCKTYSDPETCSVCEFEYFLITTPPSQCQSITTVANCLTYLNATTCSACYPEYNINGNTCPGNQAAVNCMTFSTAGICTSCNTNYFDVSGICTALGPISNCQTFSNPTTCTLCQTGFLNIGNSQCSPNTPTTCAVFQDPNVCLTCKPGYFLSGNYCLDPNPHIGGCEVYQNETVCQTCQSTNFLTAGICPLKQTIVNCVTHASATTCATCDPNFFPQGIQCFAASGVPSCITYSSLTQCSVCQDKYYLILNVCEAPVLNCAEHTSHNICDVCEQGYVLSVDGSECKSNYADYNDLNCKEAFLTATPFCSICSSGHFFSPASLCDACVGNTPASGCFSCDPTDNSKCMLCRTGYYQTPSGTCALNSSAPPLDPSLNSNPLLFNTGPPPNSPGGTAGTNNSGGSSSSNSLSNTGNSSQQQTVDNSTTDFSQAGNASTGSSSTGGSSTGGSSTGGSSTGGSSTGGSSTGGSSTGGNNSGTGSNGGNSSDGNTNPNSSSTNSDTQSNDPVKDAQLNSLVSILTLFMIWFGLFA